MKKTAAEGQPREAFEAYYHVVREGEALARLEEALHRMCGEATPFQFFQYSYHNTGTNRWAL